MKYKLECEDLDGLVLIDKSCLKEFDSDMLYAMDIFLDTHGKTELIFDFPNEDWSEVWSRETKPIKEFCSNGKMIVWLSDNIEKDGSIEIGDYPPVSAERLNIPTGKLLAITASELIQCLSYPELEPEIVFEFKVKPGRYFVWNEGMDKIWYSEETTQKMRKI